MKPIIPLLFAAVFLTASASDSMPPLPQDVTLTSGVTLHHVSVVKWGNEQVVLKHDGGADPIRYSNMVAADRAAFETARDYRLSHAVAKTNPEVSFTGQALINIFNEGPVKVGGMTIYAFPMSVLSEFDAIDSTEPVTIKLPKPLTSVVTDGDGNFKMTVPGNEPFFIFALVWRSFGTERQAFLHRYRWLIKSSDIRDDIILSQSQKMGPLEASVTLDIATE